MKQLKSIAQIVTKVDGNAVQGLWTVYGVVDSYGDRSHAGLYGSATPYSTRFMFNHDIASPPVAKITRLWEVSAADLPAAVRSAYPEASGGAMVERTYIDTPRGQEVRAAVLAGAITDMSYGFETKRTALTRNAGGANIRELYEVDLIEISDVAVRGAVPGTMSNIAAKAGYRYAGGLAGKAGARHSAADVELLQRIHDDVLALGAACETGKAAKPLWLLKAKLDLFTLQMGVGSSVPRPKTMAEMRQQLRQLEKGVR